MEHNRISHQEMAKWLKVLMTIAIVGIVNIFIGIPAFVPTAVTAWVSRILMAVTIAALLKLAPANERYKKAGIQLTIGLILMIARELLNTGSVLVLISSTLSLLARYQEYHGHSELIADKDPQLSGKWPSLFIWSIVVGIVVSFGATAAGVLVAVTGMDIEKAAMMIAAVMMIPEYGIEILYILYLKKMTALFAEDKVCENDV